MSPEEAAAYRNVSRQTIYNWIKNGEIPASKIGRTWRVKRRDIDGGE